MVILFTTHGWEDFCYWLDTDHTTAIKIRALITSIKQHPFKGLGKPEPLDMGLRVFGQEE